MSLIAAAAKRRAGFWQRPTRRQTNDNGVEYGGQAQQKREQKMIDTFELRTIGGVT